MPSLTVGLLTPYRESGDEFLLNPGRLNPVDGASAIWRSTTATLGVRMKSIFIVDGYFFIGSNVAQREEQYMAIESLHESVRLA